MRKIFFILILFGFYYSNACHSIAEAKWHALKNNCLIIVNFNDKLTNQNVKEFTFETEDIHLLKNTLQLNFYKGTNNSDIKKYNITSFPTLLILDAYGEEIYKYSNVNNDDGIKSVLRNFNFFPDYLNNDLNSFDKKNNYYSALRIAQTYLYLSLAVEEIYKANVINLSNVYLAKAEKLLRKKDELFAEKIQKINLFKMYSLAYGNNYSELNKRLSTLSEFDVLETNKPQYHFLKYILIKNDYPQNIELIKIQALLLDGFEELIKKADVIAAQK